MVMGPSLVILDGNFRSIPVPMFNGWSHFRYISVPLLHVRPIPVLFPFYSRCIPVLFPFYSRSIPVPFRFHFPFPRPKQPCLKVLRQTDVTMVLRWVKRFRWTNFQLKRSYFREFWIFPPNGTEMERKPQKRRQFMSKQRSLGNTSKILD